MRNHCARFDLFLTALCITGIPGVAAEQSQAPDQAAHDTIRPKVIETYTANIGGSEVMPLWPAGAPGAVGDTPADKPTLTVFLPSADKANGAAVVICPGGGYGGLAVDHEGTQVAQWLNSFGVAGFVVRYRLGPRYHHPAPLNDASRAVRLVRARAAAWKVDPKRVGVMGFSAGGHLAATLATHFSAGDPATNDPVEQFGCRPDFAILCYPVITFVGPYAHAGSRRNLLGDDPDPKLVELLCNDKQVTAETPPTFLFHTSDDPGVPVQNGVMFYLALRQANVPAEMHLYESGPHGVGLAQKIPALATWPKLCEDWLHARGLLKRAEQPR